MLWVTLTISDLLLCSCCEKIPLDPTQRCFAVTSETTSLSIKSTGIIALRVPRKELLVLTFSLKRSHLVQTSDVRQGHRPTCVSSL